MDTLKRTYISGLSPRTRVVGVILTGTIIYYGICFIASRIKASDPSKGLKGLVDEIEMIFFWANMHAIYFVGVLSCALLGWIVAKTYRDETYLHVFRGVFFLYLIVLIIIYFLSNYT